MDSPWKDWAGCQLELCARWECCFLASHNPPSWRTIAVVRGGFCGCTVEHVTVLSSTEPPGQEERVPGGLQAGSAVWVLHHHWTYSSVPAMGREISYLRRWLLHSVSLLCLHCAHVWGERAPCTSLDLWAGCPERSKRCLSICFLPISRWGWNGQGVDANCFSLLSVLPSHQVSSGWPESLSQSQAGGSNLLLACCWPLMAINYYMP